MLAPDCIIAIHDTGTWAKKYFGPGERKWAEGSPENWINDEEFLASPGEREFVNWVMDTHPEFSAVNLHSMNALRNGFTLLQRRRKLPVKRGRKRLSAINADSQLSANFFALCLRRAVLYPVERWIWRGFPEVKGLKMNPSDYSDNYSLKIDLVRVLYVLGDKLAKTSNICWICKTGYWYPMKLPGFAKEQQEALPTFSCFAYKIPIMHLLESTRFELQSLLAKIIN